MDGNPIPGRTKPSENGLDTIPALFSFDTSNLTDSDISILRGLVVESLPGQTDRNATFRNDKFDFEAEGMMTGVLVSDEGL